MLRLFVMHESGWCDMMVDAGAWPGTMNLRDWCSVSGVVMVGGKPAAGLTVTIEPLPVPNFDKVNRQVFRTVVTTDANGNFTATRVADGKMLVGVRHTVPAGTRPSRYLQGKQVVVDLRPGENRQEVVLDGAVPEGK